MQLTLDQEQHDALEVRAAAAGLSRQRYLLEAALTDERRTVPERRATAARLAAVMRDLQGVATNLNQLTKVANSIGVVVAGTSEALDEITELLPQLREAIDELR